MKPPHSACLVAGTQADATGGPSSANEIAIMKFDNLTRTKANKDEEDSDQSDDEDDDEEEGANDEDAVMTYRSIPHAGGVNRIRAQQMPMPYSSPAPQPPNGNYHVATFSETGKVHIFDIAPHLASLQHPSTFSGANLNNKPVYTVESHKRAEGFALAWSPQLPNSDMTRLLSGDIHSKIYMTNMTQSGFETSSGVPFASHTSSIEDIQWSPTEKTVFGSVSADRSMRIWDIRVRDRKSVLAATEAHDSDINVMSWNTGASANYLIITGGDEGGIKVWDLRNMKGGKGGKTNATPVASFDWHKAPITSIEWHPTEDSCFAAASADDTVTLWDLSVELDEEEKGQQSARADKTKDVPPQLLFVHAGQKEVKELHWHPQIPGSVITTSLDNFAVFKTISL
jgi:ribosome assembly protein RRB1